MFECDRDHKNRCKKSRKTRSQLDLRQTLGYIANATYDVSLESACANAHTHKCSEVLKVIKEEKPTKPKSTETEQFIDEPFVATMQQLDVLNVWGSGPPVIKSLNDGVDIKKMLVNFKGEILNPKLKFSL